MALVVFEHPLTHPASHKAAGRLRVLLVEGSQRALSGVGYNR